MSRRDIGNLFFLAFYAGLVAVMLTIWAGLPEQVLPAQLADLVSNNSEAYVLAVVLLAWIQTMGRRLPIAGAWAAGAVCALIGFALLPVETSSVRTLNESFFALALLIPYVSARRPLARWMLWLPAALVVVVVIGVAWDRQQVIVDQAETVGFLVLLPIALDLVDHQLLDTQATPRAVAVRALFYSLMVVIPVAISAMGMDVRDAVTLTGQTLDYLGRIIEAFMGVLLVGLALNVRHWSVADHPPGPTARHSATAQSGGAAF